MDTKNLAIIRQSFAQTVFTHQVQEAAAHRKNRQSRRMKYIHILLVSLVLALLALQANNLDSPVFAFIAAGITVAEIILLIVQLTFDTEHEAIIHKNSALKYMALRDRYRLLITDVMNEETPKRGLIARRDALQQEYQAISDLAPQTELEDYNTAQDRLNLRGKVSNEQFTWSDEEIDHFLPETLRLNN